MLLLQSSFSEKMLRMNCSWVLTPMGQVLSLILILNKLLITLSQDVQREQFILNGWIKNKWLSCWTIQCLFFKSTRWWIHRWPKLKKSHCKCWEKQRALKLIKWIDIFSSGPNLAYFKFSIPLTSSQHLKCLLSQHIKSTTLKHIASEMPYIYSLLSHLDKSVCIKK